MTSYDNMRLFIFVVSLPAMSLGDAIGAKCHLDKLWVGPCVTIFEHINLVSLLINFLSIQTFFPILFSMTVMQ